MARQGLLEGIAEVEARAYGVLADMGASPLTKVLLARDFGPSHTKASQTTCLIFLLLLLSQWKTAFCASLLRVPFRSGLYAS